VHVAHTPCTDALKENKARWRTIKAHGLAVGLPSDDDMGNSEVRAGRRAGRCRPTPLPRSMP
jgi:bisphosphoglycerate-independent phosphoglycerate mutase (AlkP superfamily)